MSKHTKVLHSTPSKTASFHLFVCKASQEVLHQFLELVKLGKITHHCHGLHIKNVSVCLFRRSTLPRRPGLPRRSGLPLSLDPRCRTTPPRSGLPPVAPPAGPRRRARGSPQAAGAAVAEFTAAAGGVAAGHRRRAAGRGEARTGQATKRRTWAYSSPPGLAVSAPCELAIAAVGSPPPPSRWGSRPPRPRGRSPGFPPAPPCRRGSRCLQGINQGEEEERWSGGRRSTWQAGSAWK